MKQALVCRGREVSILRQLSGGIEMCGDGPRLPHLESRLVLKIVQVLLVFREWFRRVYDVRVLRLYEGAVGLR